MANSWRMDDLDGGLKLAADLSNLHGLGAEFMDSQHQQVYDMSEVLSLPMFKSETTFPESVADMSDHYAVDINSLTSCHIEQEKTHKSPASPTSPRFAIILKAQTAPGRKLNEETLTYLNQSQSYEILLQCLSGLPDGNQFLKSTVRVGFHDRKYQVVESEKFEEWISHRQNERILEIDVPMCVGIHDVANQAPYTNFAQFKWETKADTRLFIKVNCVSSEFTKGKSGGESGIPLRLQIDTYLSSSTLKDKPVNTSGCKIKVFKPKGADRKLKSEKSKHENLSKEETDTLQPSYDVTVLKELEPLESSTLKRNASSSSSSGFQGDASWLSPCSSLLSQLQLTGTMTASTPLTHSPRQQQQQQDSSQQSSQSPHVSGIADNFPQNSIADSTVEETQRWLEFNRFNHFLTTFANFKGSDLLMLTRSDLIQLCGPADGIRLASRPLLTIYVSPEWEQSDTGMTEYHAIFLEHLTANELKQKLAVKCQLETSQVYTLYKQGPTGILIYIDDEMPLMDSGESS
eukprot:gene3411-3902_t